MLRGFAAGLVALALVATPAAAQNVSGWYAGIYGGGTIANTVELGINNYMLTVDQTGTIQTPTSFVNDGGIASDFFDFLTATTVQYPYADLGAAAVYWTRGSLASKIGPSLGVVVGYGLGNGVRLEGDLSSSSTVGGIFASQSELVQGAEGEIDGSGVWTWTWVGDNSFPVTPPVLLEDVRMHYSSDAQFLLFSAYHDIQTGGQLTPYLGGGVGIARVTSTFYDTCLCISGTQTRLTPAAQLGGGVRAALTDLVTLDIGYRYKFTGELGFSVTDAATTIYGSYADLITVSGIFGVHTLQAGLTFALP